LYTQQSHVWGSLFISRLSLWIGFYPTKRIDYL